MSEVKIKPYKETNKDVLFTKDYFSEENDNGVSYPKNRITVSSIDYEGEYKDFEDKIHKYEGTKYRISNCKLELDDDVVVKKKKTVKFYGNDKIVDDEKVCDLAYEHLKDILTALELK